MQEGAASKPSLVQSNTATQHVFRRVDACTESTQLAVPASGLVPICFPAGATKHAGCVQASISEADLLIALVLLLLFCSSRFAQTFYLPAAGWAWG